MCIDLNIKNLFAFFRRGIIAEDIWADGRVLEGAKLLYEGLESFFAGIEDGDVFFFFLYFIDDLFVGVDVLAYFLIDVLEAFLLLRDVLHILLLYHDLAFNYYTYQQNLKGI